MYETIVRISYFVCSVKTELLPEKAISRLFIANANRQDTGNYTCSLDSKIEASVLAHVLIGKLNGTW